MFVTDNAGRVIADVTRVRTKPVIPGIGFGPKREPSAEEIELLDALEKTDAPKQPLAD